MNRFGGETSAESPRLIGKTISLNGSPHEVVGVASAVETTSPQPVDVWMPFQIDPNSTSHVNGLRAVGRLKRGRTLSEANAHLQLAVAEFRSRFPASISPEASFRVQRYVDTVAGDARSSLFVLLGAVTFVLLMACSNVANFLLVRATGRGREIAVRAALGASRGRIIRQLLTESVLLSIAGSALGLLLGISGVHALMGLNPGNIPRIGEHGGAVSVDWRVLSYTAFMALVAGVVFGLIPAFNASRSGLSIALSESGERAGGGFRQNKIRSLLVVTEISLALILLVGAALLIRTFVSLRTVRTGFDSHNVLTVRMSLSGARFVKTSAVAELAADGVQRIRALPGIVTAAVSCCLPLEGDLGMPFIVEGRPLSGRFHGAAQWVTVSPDYFSVFKIPITRGRAFTDHDASAAAGVVIINRAMADRFWARSSSSGDPLKDRLILGKVPGAPEPPSLQIIGVVGDVRDAALNREPQPTVYTPVAQVPDYLNALIVRLMPVAWIVRTRAEPQSVSSVIQTELKEASGGLPVARVLSMAEITARSTAREDFNMVLLTIFGGLALFLAAIGIYGLMAYSVEQRKREIGIRLALGAESTGVRNMVLVQGMRLGLIGVSTGMAGAFGLTRLISGLLFGVKPLDPVVFTTVPLLLSLVVLFAIWLPATRASRVDCIATLRDE